MLTAILIVSLIVRLLVISVPQPLWWDGAIYVGMGKTLFSNGAIGLWEPFRPVVWPAILGFFWKIGLDPYAAGIILVLFSSIGALYFVYRIGEKIKSGSGIYSAILFSFTPLFIGFTSIPLTDIPALFLGLGAVYLYSKDRFFLSGLVLSLSFLFRFPQAIMFVSCVLGLAILFYETRRLRPAILFIVGFIILTSGYFILNVITYGDPLYPIKAGSLVASQSVGPYDTVPLFYIATIFTQNLLYIFAIIFLYVCIRKPQSLLKNRAAFLSLTSAILLILYFSTFPHKEHRYALAFLPYVALMAGYGISTIVEKIHIRHIQLIAPSALAVFLLTFAYFMNASYVSQVKPLAEQEAFYAYFADKAGSRIITSSPQIIVSSDVKIVGLNDTWEDLYDDYKRHSSIDYIALDTCQIICRTQNCDSIKEKLLQELATQNFVAYNENADSCSYRIYKTIR